MLWRQSIFLKVVESSAIYAMKQDWFSNCFYITKPIFIAHTESMIKPQSIVEWILTGPCLERVRRMQLHPSILNNWCPCMHPSIFRLYTCVFCFKDKIILLPTAFQHNFQDCTRHLKSLRRALSSGAPEHMGTWGLVPTKLQKN